MFFEETTEIDKEKLENEIKELVSKYGTVRSTTIKESSEKEKVMVFKEPKVKKEKVAKEPKIKKEKTIKPLSKSEQVAKKKKNYSSVSDSPIEMGMDR